MHPLLNIAIRAARIAGSFIVKHYETPNPNGGIEKSQYNFFTNLNHQAEALIIKTISKSYPQHTIIGKEYREAVHEYHNVQWIIDPLDGTNNFIKRLPHFSVSIAVRIKNRTEIAVVYDPIRNELFSATRGQGTQLNGYRLRGSTTKNLDGAILATGFPFQKKKYSTNYITLLNKLFMKCADFRWTGSAALDFAYVAAGRIDGFCEIGLKPWNFTSGELLVREAGGLVTDFKGEHNHLFSGNIVAGTPIMVKSILLVIRDNLNQ